MVVVVATPLIDVVTLLRLGIGLTLVGFAVAFLVLLLSRKSGKKASER
jgi:hypothetical protein